MNHREFLALAGTVSLIAMPALPTLAQPATEPVPSGGNHALPATQAGAGRCGDHPLREGI